MQYLYISEPCRFQRKERLESPMFLAILMGGKYLLYIINEIVNMVGDLIYTFKYRKIITLI